jgi:hypothetical protein
LQLQNNNDLNLYKDLISDDDDEYEIEKHDNLKVGYHSKRIKKHQSSSRGSKSSLIDQDFKENEKIKDMGEYWLIHKLNPVTKRLNQMLMCKSCPLKFPKLCNLRDHLRIHKDQMPFKCKLCGKPFT